MGSAVPAFVGFSRFWPLKARLGGLFHGDPAEIRTPDTLLKRQVRAGPDLVVPTAKSLSYQRLWVFSRLLPKRIMMLFCGKKRANCGKSRNTIRTPPIKSPLARQHDHNSIPLSFSISALRY